MKTESKIQVSEFNDVELGISERKEIKVRNHWNRKSLVVLVVGRNRYTVDANELIRAINNAQNSHKF